jgi:hypothetical protein
MAYRTIRRKPKTDCREEYPGEVFQGSRKCGESRA